MRIRVFEWFKKYSTILFNTGSLVATMIVTSVLGFAFWWVAARFYPSGATNLATVAITQMMLLGTLFFMGQGTLLITELPRNRGHEGRLTSASLIVVSLATFFPSAAFAILVPRLSSVFPTLAALAPLSSSPLNVVLFATGAVLSSVTMLLDQVMIALLHGEVQLWRNSLFSVAKLLLLVAGAAAFSQTTGMSIYAAWALGNLLSLLPVIIFLIQKKKLALKYYIPEWAMMRRLGRASIQHQSLNLVLLAPSQLLPTIALALISQNAGSWFYYTSMIANFVFALSVSLTTVLHAVNAAQVTTLAQKARMTVSLSFLASVGIGAILILGAPQVLSLFKLGDNIDAVSSLRILMLGSLPLIIKNHFISFSRIQDRVGKVVLPMVFGSVLELVLAGLGAHAGGLTGLCLGWVIAMLVEAVFMLPSVAKVLLGRTVLESYIDDVVASDTMLLPAAAQFSQSGSLEAMTLGNTMMLAEIETMQLVAVRIRQGNTGQFPAVSGGKNRDLAWSWVNPDSTPVGNVRSMKDHYIRQTKLVSAPVDAQTSADPKPSVSLQNKKDFGVPADMEEMLEQEEQSRNNPLVPVTPALPIVPATPASSLSMDAWKRVRAIQKQVSTQSLPPVTTDTPVPSVPSASTSEDEAAPIQLETVASEEDDDNAPTTPIRKSDLQREHARQLAERHALRAQEVIAEVHTVHLPQLLPSIEIEKQQALNTVAEVGTMHMLLASQEKERAHVYKEEKKNPVPVLTTGDPVSVQTLEHKKKDSELDDQLEHMPTHILVQTDSGSIIADAQVQKEKQEQQSSDLDDEFFDDDEHQKAPSKDEIAQALKARSQKSQEEIKQRIQTKRTSVGVVDGPSSEVEPAFLPDIMVMGKAKDAIASVKTMQLAGSSQDEPDQDDAMLSTAVMKIALPKKEQLASLVPDDHARTSLVEADWPVMESPSVTVRHLIEYDDLDVIRDATILDRILDFFLYLAPIAAFAVWWFALKQVNVRQMNDLGLISVFPPSLIGALVVMTVGFCFVIRRPRRYYPALILYFALLIFMLYGVNTLIEEMPRFAVVYRHAGYTEYIMRTGTVDPNLDAYFSWPGFFSLSAFLTIVGGYHDILSFATWSPVFYNIMYFGPLYILFSAFTKNKRIIWLALWFFYLTNWIGQDYYSPQGLNFFFYLVIIAIFVKWFKVPVDAKPVQLWPRLRKIRFMVPLYAWLTAPDPLPRVPSQSRQRIALIACMITIFAFVVCSHQLTPFFTLLSVFALVIARRCRLWWLPILMTVMTAAWILIMTQTYLAGHLWQVFNGIHILSSFSQNVAQRVAGNPQHTFIARLRTLMSALVWGIAAISGFIRWRRGYKDATIILLALTPFPFFIIQPYGGEMLLRSYLFSLPSMVFLMAALFYNLPQLKFFYNLPQLAKEYLRVVATVALCLVLLGGFFFTRYGNEDMDYMTNDEVAGVRYLYGIAPDHSLFMESYTGAPVQFEDYEKYTLHSLQDLITSPTQSISTLSVATIAKYLQSNRTGGNVYILFTRSEKVTYDTLSGNPPGSLDTLEQKIAASGDFNLIYQNPDVQIYQFVSYTEGTSK